MRKSVTGSAFGVAFSADIPIADVLVESVWAAGPAFTVMEKIFRSRGFAAEATS